MAYFEGKRAEMGVEFIELPQKEDIRDDNDEMQGLLRNPGKACDPTRPG
jgi:hypothetical protein